MAERDQLLAAIEKATSASSIHNSQPWRFEILGDAIAVSLDASETPRTVDPVGRWALASIGAAIANLEIALLAAGIDVDTEVRVDDVPATGDLAGGQAYAGRPLAVVTLGEDAPAAERVEGARRLDAAIPDRFTTREPLTGGSPTFAEWTALGEVVAGGLGDLSARVAPHDLAEALLALTARSEVERQDDADYLEEVQEWIERTEATGIPGVAVGLPDAEGRVPTRDFTQTPMGSAATGEAAFFEKEPALLVLSGSGDGAGDQLLGGYAMQRAMLEATALGLGIGVLGQALEEPVYREQVDDAASAAFGESVVVHQILRLGHPATPLTHTHTPRRPVAEVVL
jgi:nitroreductase